MLVMISRIVEDILVGYPGNVFWALILGTYLGVQDLLDL
jgi:hypothetical protein